MIVRVLDDAVYKEYLLIDDPEKYRDVVLESVEGKAPVLRTAAGQRGIVWIHGVPGFTLRGFRLDSGNERHVQVRITERCPSVVLDRLDMTCAAHTVELSDVPLAGKDAPVVIQGCTLRTGGRGVNVDGCDGQDRGRSRPCGHVVIRDNTFIRCGHGVFLEGEVRRIHVVGNRFAYVEYGAIDLRDLRAGTAEVVVANNTLLRNLICLRIWDDSSQKDDFLAARDVRFQNNLVLAPTRSLDLVFKDHVRGVWFEDRRGDLKRLLNSPQWRFSHNWREVEPEKAANAGPSGSWIPACPGDRLLESIDAGSRKPAEANFLRPGERSPLGSAGAGAPGPALAALASLVGTAGGGPTSFSWTAAAGAAHYEPALPPYVGAVPPEGAEPWDWGRTWKELTR
jgi:hypothetical protein